MELIMEKTMIKKFKAVFTAMIIITIVLFAGCGETPAPPDDFSGSQNVGGGGEGAVPNVPGSGGRPVGAWLNKLYNADPAAGKPGLRISALTQGEISAEELTTQKTLGLWEDNKFHIEGIGAQFNGGYQNAGFVDVLLLYYDQPFEEEFKISARVRINRAGGVSTSKGIHVGAYSNMGRDPIEDDDGNLIPNWFPQQGSKGIGLFLRAESRPQFRLYYSDQFASTTAGNSQLLSELIDLNINKEYIYEISRVKINPALPFSEEVETRWPNANTVLRTRNAQYEFKLLDSKTYLPVVYRGNPPAAIALPVLPIDAPTHPVGGATIEMHPSVRGSVYAGVCISASVAEISQIKIWTTAGHGGSGMNWDYRAIANEDGSFTGAGDEPLFKTPDTIPAYVPANSILPYLAPTKQPSDQYPNENVFIWSSLNTPAQWPALAAANYTITLNPRPSPDFADNEIHYQLFYIPGTAHNAFLDNSGKIRIQGAGSRQELLDDQSVVIDEAYKSYTIQFDPDKINGGETITAQFLLVARDLNLDSDKGTPNYSLLQTLPDYLFRVQITKPVQ